MRLPVRIECLGTILMRPDLFRATNHQITSDRMRRQALLLSIPAALIILWISWMGLARINVYATTEQARVEVAQTAFIVQAPVPGRVVRSHLFLGDLVKRGDVLVELESEPQQLRVDEEQAHLTALETQLSNLRDQIGIEQGTLLSERGAGDATAQEAQANLAKAEEAEKFSRKEAAQKVLLFRDGLVAQLDVDRFQAEADEKSSELKAARGALAKAQRQKAIQGGERRLRIETLNKENAEIQ